MKILEANRERKVSSSELADWFGIAYGTYRNQRKKKLEELKDFCDYEEVYGGVIIKEVYFDEYYKYQDDENRVLKVILDILLFKQLLLPLGRALLLEVTFRLFR